MYLHKLSGFVLRITVLFLVGTASLYSHAILLDAAPTANQVIDGHQTRIMLRFNSRIDAKRSRITLIASDGRRLSLDIDKQASDDALSSNVKDLQRGTYVLRWQVLAYDGHITRGEIRFQVR